MKRGEGEKWKARGLGDFQAIFASGDEEGAVKLNHDITHNTRPDGQPH